MSFQCTPTKFCPNANHVSQIPVNFNRSWNQCTLPLEQSEVNQSLLFIKCWFDCSVEPATVTNAKYVSLHLAIEEMMILILAPTEFPWRTSRKLQLQQITFGISNPTSANMGITKNHHCWQKEGRWKNSISEELNRLQKGFEEDFVARPSGWA